MAMTVREAQAKMAALRREAEQLAEQDLEGRRRSLPNRMIAAELELHRAVKAERTAALIERLKGPR